MMHLHHAHVASEEQDVPPHPAGSELGGDQVSLVILVLGVSKQCLLHICSFFGALLFTISIPSVDVMK